MYFVYLLKSLINNKTYVGYTAKDLLERLNEHNLGSNSWTSANKPFKLIYYESYYCKKDALHRELFLKSKIGKRLVKLIKDNY
jgi:putative endonuclease